MAASTEWICASAAASCAGRRSRAVCELVAAQNPRRDREPRDELHQVARALSEPPAGGLEGDGRRDRDPGQVGGLDRAQLDLERGERHPAPRLSAQHVGGLAAGADEERLARGTALDRAQLELARIVAGLGEYLAHRRGVGGLSRRRHRLRARARGG